MNGLQFYDYDPAVQTGETVSALRSAMVWMQAVPLEWQSADGSSFYQAIPTDFEKVKAHITELPEMPAFAVMDMMNLWSVERLGPNAGGELPLRIDRMLVGAGVLMMDASVEFDPLAPDFDQATGSAELKERLGEKFDSNQSSNLETYAHLDNGLFDLKPLKEIAAKAWMDAQKNMTDQEKRLKRMMKFDYLIQPETDKTAKPSWWTISESSLLYTVRASSPDEAAAILDEHHEREFGSGIFPIFFIDKCSEETTADFDATLVHDAIVRLIPFSNVPWPEDPDNMTAAQREAFDQLKS